MGDASRSSLERVVDTDGFTAMVRAKHGYFLYNKNDFYIGRSIEKYGEFSEYEVALFRQICAPNDVVIEVGSNIGSHTIALAQMVGPRGHIYAFEPQRIVFQTLCGNVAINSLTNVSCFQSAVGEESGTAFIPALRYDRVGNFGGVSVRASEGGESVSQVTLDNLLDNAQISQLKLLKVDVEGMEIGVIQGAKEIISKFKPILYVENDRQVQSGSLIVLIRSLGYRLYWHLPPLYNPKNFAGDRENIYPGIVSINMLCFPDSANVQVQGLVEVKGPEDFPVVRQKD